jgi:hypothetical protein
MKNVISAMFLFVCANCVLLGQQAKVTVSQPNPAPGETVVIEVDVSPDKNTKLSWTSDGVGEFLTETKNQSKVQFKPTAPGSTVIIVCNISTPKDHQSPSIKLQVSGAQKVIPPVPQPQPLVAGDLALADMEYMVPAGFMGDAMAENNEAATLDPGYSSGCRQGSPACIKIEYKPTDGKVGWAAFAWQRVIEGSANWGESPGADFSKGGYRSLRVFAKGLSDSGGNLPKVQFKSGGNVAPKFNSTNRATYAAAGPTVQLTSTFKDYCVSLENRDLTNTVSPFTVVVTKAGGPRGSVVLLEDVRFSKNACP